MPSSKQKFIDAIATILIFVGLLVALSPHVTHMAAGHDPTHTHEKEITIGLIIFIVGVVSLIKNNDSWKWKK